MKRILIVGATSAIAAACARLWAAEGARFFLVGRNPGKLEAVAADLRVRGGEIAGTRAADLAAMEAHGALVAAAREALGGMDIALIAHGSLPDQEACQGDAALTVEQFTINGLAAISLLTVLAPAFAEQGHGALAVITSVAGDRGRPSNYVYGSAKAAVSAFCEGLRARLFKAGVSLTDIRPGFVATPMTRGLPLPPALVAEPEAVGRRIVAAIAAGKDVVYAPAYWAWIMAAIRLVPGFLFKRLKL